MTLLNAIQLEGRDTGLEFFHGLLKPGSRSSSRHRSHCRYVHNHVRLAMGESEHKCWDNPKNERNIHTRLIDFAGLDAAFDGRFALVVEDHRREYGEQRFNMLVEMNEVVLHITFTLRLPKYRIISARVASRKERRLYHAQQQDQ